MTKISIKLKQTNEPPPKIKISLKKDINSSLSEVQKTNIKERAIVSYVFLEEGQFLFDKRTCNLYTIQAPYKKMGIISREGHAILL